MHTCRRWKPWGTPTTFSSVGRERSRRVAAALYEWVPMVVQTAEPWMSEEDIEKGSRSLDDVGKALATMGVGIICLTPENLERPWILFEAGALSKALGDKTRVGPYLFGNVRAENVKPPLGMFQATRAVKDDTRKLVATVNRVLEGPLAEEKLDTVFERMWPELQEKLEAIASVVAAAPAPARSEKEMIAEVLELVRAGAGGGKALEEISRLREALERSNTGMGSLSAISRIRDRLVGEKAETRADAAKAARRVLQIMSEHPTMARMLANHAEVLADMEKIAIERRIAEISEEEKKSVPGEADGKKKSGR